ncbi:G-protein coupled receptor 39 [Amia ocellicauda]|uniref:G-protein coupled receptor 39 n=1 Tax=Amia ocellicauda TaxID=2972642 RepID=UPI003464C0A6|nr:GPR39 protein [Amia calva]
MDTNKEDCLQYMNRDLVHGFEPKLTIKILLTVLYAFIFLVGITGNSITIKVTQVLLKNGYLQKSVTDHMVSLACSDLLVLLLGMPVEMYSVIWFPFSTASGNASCKIYHFLFETCSYATIFNVATLSFERYIAICHPFKYKSLSGSRTIKLIVSVWVASVLVALPLLFTTGIEDPLEQEEMIDVSMVQFCPMQKSNRTICTNLLSMWTVYRASIFSAFIVYVMVLVSVTFMCRKMMKVLMGAKAGNKKQKDVQYLPKHESSQSKASRKQTILFLGLIVGALAVCWMPTQVRRIMTAVKPKTKWTEKYFWGYMTLLPIADTFFYLSSVLNPLLYNLSSRQFREVFLQVMRCRLTIEHVNRRVLRRSDVASARSTRPLMLASIRRGLSSYNKAKSHKFTTFQRPAPTPASDSPSPPTDSTDLTNGDQSAVDLVRQKNSVLESEV